MKKYHFTSIIYLILFLVVIQPIKAQFTKITSGTIANDGIATSTGTFWGDYNNDGRPDLLITNAATASYLYRNNGGGGFTKITSGELATDIGGNTSGASWGDFDNDSRIDLYIGNNTANKFLYKNSNNNPSLWTKVLTASPINTVNENLNGVMWNDYDNDGDLDMYVINTGNNSLYQNSGSGTMFTQILTGDAVSDGSTSYNGSWADYDNDRDIDLFVANYLGQNDMLFENNGTGTLTKILTGPLVSDGKSSRGSSWGDYDNDGDLDLYVTVFANPNLLYRNDGGGNFTSITGVPPALDSHNPRSSVWLDYDNDGDLDLFVTGFNEVNRLYRNNGGSSFTKITTGAIVTTTNKAVSCSTADYDSDGDLDIVIGNEDEHNFLYRNSGSSNKWLRVNLRGTISNTSALGARISIFKTGLGWQTREISAQTGYSAQNELTVHFGLRTYTDVEILKIEWPSGIVQQYFNLSSNQTLSFIEANPTITVLDLAPPSGSVASGTNNHILQNLSIQSDNADTEITSIGFQTGGTYATSDIEANGFKLWYNATSNTFSGATQVASSVVVPSTSTMTFIPTNLSVATNSTGYFWVTADISSTATPNNNIFILSTTASNIIVPSGTPVVAFPSNGGLQTITGTPDIALASPTISAANVSAGTANHILYQLTAAPTLANTVLTAVNFTTNGTYAIADLQANSFRLWYNTTNNFTTATTIDTKAIVSSGNQISFTGLSQSIAINTTGYFWLSADIATGATDANAIGINAPTLADILFTSGNKTGTLVAGGLQTITVTPGIALASPAISAANVSAGTANHILYQLTAAPTLANAVLTAVNFTTNGTYAIADLQANSFRLRYNTTNNFATAATIGTKAIVSSGNQISFTGLSQSIAINTTGYFWLSADIATGATDANAIGINAPTPADILFTSGNKTGTLVAGGLQTITVTPGIALASPAISAANVSAGTANHILYQFTAAPTLANAVLTAVNFTTNGTYAIADLQANSFKVRYNTTNNFATATTIGTKAIVSSGNQISFTGLSQSIAINTTGYFWLTADIATGATNGNAIGINAPILTDILFTSGNKTGTLVAGGLQTIITNPSIGLASPVISASDVSAGTANHILYQLTTAPTLANTTLTDVNFTTNGTYAIADLQANSFRLRYNTTNNFTTATTIGTKAIVGAGSQISFTGLSQSIAINTTGYFWLTADIAATSTFGNTIGINAPILADILFNSGNKTGTLVAGGLQTIIANPDINLSTINIAAANVPSGTTSHILYKFTALVNKLGIALNEVDFVTNGSYQTNDLAANSFKLWQNSTDSFSSASVIATQNIVASNSTLAFTNLSLATTVNTPQYFWLTADVDNAAIAGNTIQIDCNLNMVSFTSGIKTGVMGIAGVQTFEAPVLATPHDVLLPNFFSPNGDNQNDRFILRSPNIISVNLQIFDKFGNVVYQTDDVTEATQQGWDGGYQSSGVYAWVAQVVFSDGFETNAKGELRLAK